MLKLPYTEIFSAKFNGKLNCSYFLNGRVKVLLAYVVRHWFGTKDTFGCKGVNKKCNDINKDKTVGIIC